MKICKKCSIEKPLTDYCNKKANKDGKHTTCKKCMGESNKEYYSQNKEAHNTRSTKWVNENKELHKSMTKDHYHNNKDYYRKWHKNKYDTDMSFRLKHSLAALINHHLRRGKTKNSLDYLGCTMDEYKIYLENQFNENMNWDNYGSYWEIDHNHPISKDGSFHYSNTRPLEVHENRVKSDKIV